MQEDLSRSGAYTRAGSAATSPDTLRMLARDADPRVRAAVARNPATLPSTLSLLSHDLEADVRFAVAGNPRAMSSTLTILSKDRVERVRLASAEALSKRNLVRAPAPAAEGLPLQRRGSAAASVRGSSTREPRPGMVLRYDPDRREVIAVSVRMTGDVRRYVARNWIRTRPEEDGTSGERGLGT